MSNVKQLVPLDMAQSELLNAIIQNLGSNPSSPILGQFYFNTGSNKIRTYNGSSWDEYGSATPPGSDTQVVFNDGGSFGADAGMTYNKTSNTLTVQVLVCTQTTGTAPLTITSTTVVTNLNADLLDGQHGSHYLARANHTGTQAASTISDFDSQVRSSRLDQMAAPSASVSMSSQKLTNLANGTASADAVNLSQLQSAVNGTKWRAPVRAKATGNLTLSGLQTIDGVTVVAGDRVAAFSQTTTTQDGVYVASAGGWTRADDFATGADVSNAAFFVQEGTIAADTTWNVTNNIGGAVVGTDNLVLVQFGAGTSYTADESTLTLSGTQFAIKAGGVRAAGGVTKYSALIGDGSATSISITQGTHGLSSNSQMSVSLYEVSSGDLVFCGVSINNSNGTVTLSFTVAPASNAYRVVIIG